MNEKVIGDYSGANSIDGANHYLLIQPGNSSTAYNKINRNVFLGITAQPVDISSNQTLTNKIIGITNTVTSLDTSFTLQDNSDNTKQVQFQLSGITTGTTRTYTFPNVSDTLVTLTATQTLTNKTLTAPAITGGSIDNATITVDSIAGHSSSTIVTIANLQISNGVLNSANSVTSTSIAAGAVQPQALQSGSGSGWSWATYSPTLSNITIGNGTVVAKYIQTGKQVTARITITFGSTSAMGTTPQISLPVSASSGYLAGAESYGTAQILHNGNYINPAVTIVVDTNNVEAYAIDTSTTYAKYADITSSVPFSWGTGDALYFYLSYEAA